MAYAAYRDHCTFVQPAAGAAEFKVLEVVVTTIDAYRVRQAVARCKDAGVVRSEPIAHARPTCESAESRVRLWVRLPPGSYASVLHGLLECAPSGEIGGLIGWQAYLQRYRVAFGGCARLPRSTFGK